MWEIQVGRVVFILFTQERFLIYNCKHIALSLSVFLPPFLSHKEYTGKEPIAGVVGKTHLKLVR